jgi:hypothetical protein
MIEPERILREGAALLEPTLAPFGFEFDVVNRGKSSGGWFAEGRFRSGDRELWLSYRWSLGLVRYRKAQKELTHEQYMRALGLQSVARYPGFGTEPMSAFADLLSDLKYCDAFLRDEGQAFAELAASDGEPLKDA